ncbi:MAG TPA: glycosyltransferase family 4 protein [Patescibacteria group bacterium]
MTKIKRAAVYDRWLHTLGGGEQVAFAYAEVLRDLGYQVDLLTHRQFDQNAAIRKMDVNFDGITIRYLPNLLDYQLSSYTEKYDIFVSNSYLDYIPNRSKFGILSVFFPSRVAVNPYEYFKRSHIVPSLRKFFIYPSEFEGFEYDSYENGYLHKWLGQRSCITINQKIRQFSLQLYFPQLALSSLDQIQFLVNDHVYVPKRSINHRNNTATYDFSLSQANTTQKVCIVLPKSHYSRKISLIRFSIPHYRYFFYNLFKRLFPHWEMRLHGGPSPTKFSDIESYDRIVAISKFTQYWIQKYWHLSADIIYPPVAITKFAPSQKKENIIIHVGRFFVGGHSKKQLEMVRIFKRLCDTGISDWQLHFVGGVAEGHVHQQYVQKIKDEAQEYPVFFHFDAPFTTLRELLSKAKIYWHATGLDEKDKGNPIVLEHFGITTVEAMASGCVPVVINKGGQPEIVTPESGFIWQTRRELLDSTLQLIKSPATLKRMSKEAVKRSKYFSRAAFTERLEQLLNEKNSR